MTTTQPDADEMIDEVGGYYAMRITILVRILWTAGAPKLAIAEARELRKMGHLVNLVFLRRSHLGGYEDLLRDVPHTVVSDERGTVLSPFYSAVTRLFAPERGPESRVDLGLIRKFPDLISRDRPDLVICHDQWAGLAGYLAFRRFGIPYCVYYHEHVPDYTVPVLGRIATFEESRVLRRARRVFAVTEPVAESLRSKRSVDAIPNYFGMDLLQTTPYSSKSNVLITTSMWDSGRRPWRYLDLLTNLEDYELHIVGRWRQQDPLKRFESEVKSRGLIDRVTVSVGVSESELASFFQRSKFYVRFGYNEFGCGSTPEAVQYGVPLIINQELGTSSLISLFDAGCVLSEPDSGLAARFVRQNDNEASYGRLQSNLKRLSTQYTIRKHCEILLS